MIQYCRKRVDEGEKVNIKEYVTRILMEKAARPRSAHNIFCVYFQKQTKEEKIEGERESQFLLLKSAERD